MSTVLRCQPDVYACSVSLPTRCLDKKLTVRCTVHTTRIGGGPSRSWAFASAAYAICWGFSTFAVWLGWEVYYEFWRKWRQGE